MDRLERIRQELRAFGAERDWAPFHDPKNLAMAVVSEAGELAAEYRWIANAEADAWSRDPEHRSRVAREAADVGIALLLFFDRIEVDFLEAVGAKIVVNRRNYPMEGARGRSERRRGVDRSSALRPVLYGGRREIRPLLAKE